MNGKKSDIVELGKNKLWCEKCQKVPEQVDISIGIGERTVTISCHGEMVVLQGRRLGLVERMVRFGSGDQSLAEKTG